VAITKEAADSRVIVATLEPKAIRAIPDLVGILAIVVLEHLDSQATAERQVRKALRVIKEQAGFLGTAARWDQAVIRGIVATADWSVRKGIKVFREFPVTAVSVGHKVQPDPLEPRATAVSVGHKDNRVIRVT
jgi:hypothetical protein